MTIAERLTNKIADNKKLNDTIKLRNNKIKEQDDKISALQTQLSIEENKVKKWETLQQQGYTACAINDGMIISAVTVAPYSTFTYTQKIANEINTALYQRFPYYKLDQNGKMCIDTAQAKKYKGVI